MKQGKSKRKLSYQSLLLYAVLGTVGIAYLVYIYGYLDSSILLMLSVVILSSSYMAFVLAIFWSQGRGLMDSAYCVGKQKDTPLLAIVLTVMSLGLGIYGSIKLTDASINRALDIVNSSTLVHAEGRVVRTNTITFKGHTSYEADIVYRYKNWHYSRAISCSKDEFTDGQPIRLSFPADYPRMLVIDGVLR